MNKDIATRNSKGVLHGYQEKSYSDILWYRGNVKNGNFVNYVEAHNWKETNFYIR